MLRLALLLAICALIEACGNDSKGSSPSSTSALAGAQPKKATFRTANTHLASAEGCYKQADEALCQMALQIAQLTNEKRLEQGLEPLKFHAGWSYAAQVWSSEQAEAAKISHNGFPGQRIEVYESEFGNDGEPQLAGENVGEIMLPGKSIEETAAILTQGWYDSPGHRKNMLGADYKFLGVGIYVSEDDIYYATQLFAWEAEP